MGIGVTEVPQDDGTTYSRGQTAGGHDTGGRGHRRAALAHTVHFPE